MNHLRILVSTSGYAEVYEVDDCGQMIKCRGDFTNEALARTQVDALEFTEHLGQTTLFREDPDPLNEF